MRPQRSLGPWWRLRPPVNSRQSDAGGEARQMTVAQPGACEACVCPDAAPCSCCHVEPCQAPEYPDMEELWLAGMVHAEVHYDQGPHPDDCAGPDCPIALESVREKR